MGKIVNIWSKIVEKVEPDITLELDDIIYSKKHGHEICVMHLVGKNIFPRMTAEEILSNPKARAGLSKEDLILITRLDMQIKNRKNSMHVVEIDRNGTVLLENEYGDRERKSEKMISRDTALLNKLSGKDAHGIGYRVGYKDGLDTNKRRLSLKDRLISLFKFSKNIN